MVEPRTTISRSRQHPPRCRCPACSRLPGVARSGQSHRRHDRTLRRQPGFRHRAGAGTWRSRRRCRTGSAGCRSHRSATAPEYRARRCAAACIRCRSWASWRPTTRVTSIFGPGCSRSATRICPPRRSWSSPNRSIDRLGESLHEACSLGILDGDEIVYLARSASSRIMSPALNVGRRLPAYCTSIGHVMLAHLPPQELDDTWPYPVPSVHRAHADVAGQVAFGVEGSARDRIRVREPADGTAAVHAGRPGARHRRQFRRGDECHPSGAGW